jgi:hypothetical protein
MIHAIETPMPEHVFHKFDPDVCGYYESHEHCAAIRRCGCGVLVLNSWSYDPMYGNTFNVEALHEWLGQFGE